MTPRIKKGKEKPANLVGLAGFEDHDRDNLSIYSSDNPAFVEQLCDLYGVQCRALAQIVRHDPQIQAKGTVVSLRIRET